VYVLSYGVEVLHMEKGDLLLAVNLGAAAEVVTMPLFGLLSDRTSRKGAYVAGCIVLMVLAGPCYVLLNTREAAGVIVATVLVMAGGHALLYSVQASLIPELFGTRLRYTGASLGYQLAAPVAGGLSPIIAATLVELYPDQWAPLAGYIIAVSAVSLA